MAAAAATADAVSMPTPTSTGWSTPSDRGVRGAMASSSRVQKTTESGCRDPEACTVPRLPHLARRPQSQSGVPSHPWPPAAAEYHRIPAPGLPDRGTGRPSDSSGGHAVEGFSARSPEAACRWSTGGAVEAVEAGYRVERRCPDGTSPDICCLEPSCSSPAYPRSRQPGK